MRKSTVGQKPKPTTDRRTPKQTSGGTGDTSGPRRVPQQPSPPPSPPFGTQFGDFTDVKQYKPPKSTSVLKSKDDWAVTNLTAQKDAFASRYQPTWLDRKRDPAAALHHKISKETLSGIAEALVRSYNGPKGNISRDAARVFWNVCCEVAGEQVVEAAGQVPQRLLWNLAVNVSIGPLSPVGDPGAAFDADTEPEPGRPELRRLDAVSSLLERLEDVWGRARDEDDVPAATWLEMASLLRAAQAASGREPGRLAPPGTEQWLYDPAKRQHQRKGLRYFPGVDAGEQLFRTEGWTGQPVVGGVAPPVGGGTGPVAVGATKAEKAEEIEQPVESEEDEESKDVAEQERDQQAVGGGQAHDPADVVAQSRVTGTAGRFPVALTLSLTDTAVRHIAERHTVRFFDFAQTKAVNSLWRDLDSLAAVRSRAGRALRDIARICLRELDAVAAQVDTPDQWHGEELSWGSRTADGHTVFFIVNVKDAQFDATQGIWDLQLNVKTIAPDGRSAVALLGSELDMVKGRLDPRTAPAPGPGPAGPAPQGPASDADGRSSIPALTYGKRWSGARKDRTEPTRLPPEVATEVEAHHLGIGDRFLLDGRPYVITAATGTDIRARQVTPGG